MMVTSMVHGQCRDIINKLMCGINYLKMLKIFTIDAFVQNDEIITKLVVVHLM